uniref:Cobalamin-binding protein n=1 Tax=Thermofilum adornatum TaxID=1365176 RepID=A0A7C1GBR1_9CREN
MSNASEVLYRAIVDGDDRLASDATQKLLEEGLSPREIISNILVPAMRHVGELYEKGEYFIPELVASAEAFRASMDVLRPHIKGSSDVPVTGVAVFGTVRGDIHELGKNLAAAVFEAEGFQVIDLGVDVPPERFAEAAEKYNADVVGMSALMTTTMLEQRNVIEELKKRGIREKVIVIAGGAPVTEEWVREIGADVWGRDAFESVRIVKEMLAKRRGGAR